MTDYVGIAAVPAPGQPTPDDPSTFEEAMRTKNPERWHKAFKAEVDNILANNTCGRWGEIPPPSAIVVDVKILGKAKYDAHGIFEKDKGRLVAKGYQQPAWVESFAPTSAAASTRAFLAMGAASACEIHQIDISGAFLNAPLAPGTWIRFPGWINQYLPEHLRNPTGGPVTAHLAKALYGLKEAPRAWSEELSGTLGGLGFVRQPKEASLYVRVERDGRRTWLLVYVDDILVVATCLANVERAKAEILGIYKGTDKGEASSFLGMSIERNRPERTIKLGLELFSRRLVESFGMAGRPTAGPDAPARRRRLGRRGHASGHTCGLPEAGWVYQLHVVLHEARPRPHRPATVQVHERPNPRALGRRSRRAPLRLGNCSPQADLRRRSNRVSGLR